MTPCEIGYSYFNYPYLSANSPINGSGTSLFPLYLAILKNKITNNLVNLVGKRKGSRSVTNPALVIPLP